MAPSAWPVSKDEEPPSVDAAASDVHSTTNSPPELNRPAVDGSPLIVQDDVRSVAFDVSVQGFAADIEPESSGADLVAIVVQLLREAQIQCCFAGEAALIYYGAHRVMMDWILCIEDDKLDTAAALLKFECQTVETFQQSAMKPNGTIDHYFPRFKFLGARCFFHLVPSWVYHIPCDPGSIELSRRGLPFPKLRVLAQALLDTMNRVDLQDLVDGMSLTFEWGLENLDLEGTSDTSWAARRHDFHEAHGEHLPVFFRKEGTQRMQLWKRMAAEDARAQRRGHKALPKNETRFRLTGQRDPRDLHMW